MNTNPRDAPKFSASSSVPSPGALQESMAGQSPAPASNASHVPPASGALPTPAVWLPLPIAEALRTEATRRLRMSIWRTIGDSVLLTMAVTLVLAAVDRAVFLDDPHRLWLGALCVLAIVGWTFRRLARAAKTVTPPSRLAAELDALLQRRAVATASLPDHPATDGPAHDAAGAVRTVVELAFGPPTHRQGLSEAMIDALADVAARRVQPLCALAPAARGWHMPAARGRAITAGVLAALLLGGLIINPLGLGLCVVRVTLFWSDSPWPGTVDLRLRDVPSKVILGEPILVIAQETVLSGGSASVLESVRLEWVDSQRRGVLEMQRESAVAADGKRMWSVLLPGTVGQTWVRATSAGARSRWQQWTPLLRPQIVRSWVTRMSVASGPPREAGRTDAGHSPSETMSLEPWPALLRLSAAQRATLTLLCDPPLASAALQDELGNVWPMSVRGTRAEVTIPAPASGLPSAVSRLYRIHLHSEQGVGLREPVQLAVLWVPPGAYIELRSPAASEPLLTGQQWRLQCSAGELPSAARLAVSLADERGRLLSAWMIEHAIGADGPGQVWVPAVQTEQLMSAVMNAAHRQSRWPADALLSSLVGLPAPVAPPAVERSASRVRLAHLTLWMLEPASNGGESARAVSTHGRLWLPPALSEAHIMAELWESLSRSLASAADATAQAAELIDAIDALAGAEADGVRARWLAVEALWEQARAELANADRLITQVNRMAPEDRVAEVTLGLWAVDASVRVLSEALRELVAQQAEQGDASAIRPGHSAIRESLRDSLRPTMARQLQLQLLRGEAATVSDQLDRLAGGCDALALKGRCQLVQALIEVATDPDRSTASATLPPTAMLALLDAMEAYTSTTVPLTEAPLRASLEQLWARLREDLRGDSLEDDAQKRPGEQDQRGEQVSAQRSTSDPQRNVSPGRRSVNAAAGPVRPRKPAAWQTAAQTASTVVAERLSAAGQQAALLLTRTPAAATAEPSGVAAVVLLRALLAQARVHAQEARKADLQAGPQAARTQGLLAQAALQAFAGLAAEVRESLPSSGWFEGAADSEVAPRLLAVSQQALIASVRAAALGDDSSAQPPVGIDEELDRLRSQLDAAVAPVTSAIVTFELTSAVAAELDRLSQGVVSTGGGASTKASGASGTMVDGRWSRWWRARADEARRIGVEVDPRPAGTTLARLVALLDLQHVLLTRQNPAAFAAASREVRPWVAALEASEDPLAVVRRLPRLISLLVGDRASPPSLAPASDDLRAVARAAADQLHTLWTALERELPHLALERARAELRQQLADELALSRRQLRLRWSLRWAGGRGGVSAVWSVLRDDRDLARLIDMLTIDDAVLAGSIDDIIGEHPLASVNDGSDPRSSSDDVSGGLADLSTLLLPRGGRQAPFASSPQGAGDGGSAASPVSEQVPLTDADDALLRLASVVTRDVLLSLTWAAVAQAGSAGARRTSVEGARSVAGHARSSGDDSRSGIAVDARSDARGKARGDLPGADLDGGRRKDARSDAGKPSQRNHPARTGGSAIAHERAAAIAHARAVRAAQELDQLVLLLDQRSLTQLALRPPESATPTPTAVPTIAPEASAGMQAPTPASTSWLDWSLLAPRLAATTQPVTPAGQRRWSIRKRWLVSESELDAIDPQHHDPVRQYFRLLQQRTDEAESAPISGTPQLRPGTRENTP